jgi:RNA polymerase sigma factor (sigma-70 family)
VSTEAHFQPLTIKQHMLVKRAQHVVDEEAAWLGRKYRGLVDVDDLKSEGKLALYRSVLRFDEQVSPELVPYARRRVRGSMLRLVKAETRQAKVKRSVAIASAERMANYTDDFNIQKLRDDLDELQRRIDLAASRHASAMWLAGASEAKLQAVDDPEFAVEFGETIAALEAVLKPLPEKDRTLLDLVFASGFNLEQAGEELGVDRQTAWRRTQRILEKLRQDLTALGVTRAPRPAGYAVVRPLLVPRAPPKERPPDASHDAPNDTEEPDGGQEPGPGKRR